MAKCENCFVLAFYKSASQDPKSTNEPIRDSGPDTLTGMVDNTPEFTDIHEAVLGSVGDCPGFNVAKSIIFLGRSMLKYHEVVLPEIERACNNPYVNSPEYVERARAIGF